jgi:hypothetical protein
MSLGGRILKNAWVLDDVLAEQFTPSLADDIQSGISDCPAALTNQDSQL